jgi:hypothetical protein
LVRYLLDEHIPSWLRRELLRLAPGFEVWRVGDLQAPPLGAPDPEILVWCQTYEFILVTNNRKSMPVHLKDHLDRGGGVPGIIVIDPSSSFHELVTDLALISGASLIDEFKDQIRYLPMS